MDAASKGESRREKRASGEDADLTYDLHAETVEAPWGEPVAVAYGLPEEPRKH